MGHARLHIISDKRFRCILIILNQKLLGTSIFISLCWLERDPDPQTDNTQIAQKIPRNITLFLLKRFQIIASSNQSYKNKLNFIKWGPGPFGVGHNIYSYPIITGAGHHHAVMPSRILFAPNMKCTFVLMHFKTFFIARETTPAITPMDLFDTDGQHNTNAYAK